MPDKPAVANNAAYMCAQNGLTALHLASKEGHVHVVAELLRRDADIDIATKVWVGRSRLNIKIITSVFH